MTEKPAYYKNQNPYSGDSNYTDDLFPPNMNTLLGLDSSGNPIDQAAYNKAVGGAIKKDEIEFKRAAEIFKSERVVLISDNMQMDDIVPGELEDDYFLFAVQNLCKNPGNINKLFKYCGNFQNPKGYYELVFYIDGVEQIVIVDDFLPVKKGTTELIFAKSKKTKFGFLFWKKLGLKLMEDMLIS